MDSWLPVGKRTRLRAAEMYKKMHEDLKKKRRLGEEESSANVKSLNDSTTELSSSSRYAPATASNARGRKAADPKKTADRKVRRDFSGKGDSESPILLDHDDGKRSAASRAKPKRVDVVFLGEHAEISNDDNDGVDYIVIEDDGDNDYESNGSNLVTVKNEPGLDTCGVEVGQSDPWSRYKFNYESDELENNTWGSSSEEDNDDPDDKDYGENTESSTKTDSSSEDADEEYEEEEERKDSDRRVRDEESDSEEECPVPQKKSSSKAKHTVLARNNSTISKTCSKEYDGVILLGEVTGEEGEEREGSENEAERLVPLKKSGSSEEKRSGFIGSDSGRRCTSSAKHASSSKQDDVIFYGERDETPSGRGRSFVGKNATSRHNLAPEKKRAGDRNFSSNPVVDQEELVADNEYGDGGNSAINKTRKDQEEHEFEGSKSRSELRRGRNHHAVCYNEVTQILINSMADDLLLVCEEEKEVPVEPLLPKKFTFGIEELPPPVKTAQEKEMDRLWEEMNFSLYQDANSSTNSPVVDSEADVAEEEELDRDTLCRQAKHVLILDEEIGTKCKFCAFVDVEIRYISAPFTKQSWGRHARKDLERKEDGIFGNLCDLESDTPGGNCMPHHISTGMVWDLIPGVRNSLHPHQVEGFEFLWKNVAGGISLQKLKEASCSKNGSGCVISHAPGTGKTLLAIVFVQSYLEMYPSSRPVIIAPASMLPTWEAEFEKWRVGIPFHNLNKLGCAGKEDPAATAYLKKASTRQAPIHMMRFLKFYSWRKSKSVLGISYTLFEQLTAKEKKNKNKKKSKEDEYMGQHLLTLPGLIMLDEGHTARNDNSLTWKALSKVHTEKRVILSGTPFQNNFDELYNTLWLVRPKFADGKFLKWGCYDQKKKKGLKDFEMARGCWASLTGSFGKDTDDIFEAEKLEQVRAMIKPFIHIHRGDILQEKLPGLRDSLIVLQPQGYQKRLLEELPTGKDLNFSQEYLVSILSVHPSLLEKKSIEQEELVDWSMLERHRLNPEAGVKTKFLMELVRLSVPLNERVLVFSQYKRPLKLIVEQLELQFRWKLGHEILNMDGETDIDCRQSVIKKLNDKNSDARILLASTKACSEGINLVGASRVVLLDVVWNPSVERQAISRAYRLGQEKVVYIYHLIASGTMEEGKYRRQAEKERLSELVFYTSDRTGNGADVSGVGRKLSAGLSEDKKDLILEAMVEHEKFSSMFERITYEPKAVNHVESFGFCWTGDMDEI